jgi:hypothetical protein
MSYLRRISTRRLLGLCAGVAAAGVATAALALAATGGGPTPPPKQLPVAIHDALAAPQVPGVTARIQFTNNLITSSSVQGSDPLLTGGSGRLWASAGKLRLELQSDSGRGDSEVLVDGRRFLVYSGDSGTAYRGRLPREPGKGGDANAPKKGGVPSVARIRRELNALTGHLDLSGARPSDIAGRPAYSVRFSPKRHGGLIGGGQLAWDAVHGTPLEAAVYARGVSSPVLELRATDISFGAVSDSVFALSPPPGTKVTNVAAPAGRPGGSQRQSPVTGPSAVGARLGFPLDAPSSLAGMGRSEVRLLGSKAAVVTYGRGLDGVAVFESPSSGDHPQSGQMAPGGGEVSLPKVSVGAVSGEELQTSLGTVIHFRRNGVDYTVAGSVPASVAEKAARGL